MECDLGNFTKSEAIKAGLRSRGSSLSKVGREMGLKPSTISSVLHGARSKRVEQALAEALDTTVYLLFPERYDQNDKGGANQGAAGQ